MIDEIKMGDVRDFRNFMGAVIDKKAFDKISGYIDHARAATRQIVAGGKCDDKRGLLHRADARRDRPIPATGCCCEEIFGPVVTATSTTTASGTRRCDWSTRRRRTRSPAPCSRAIGARCVEATQRAAQRRRQLLHQRQADRRGRGPAAVRRRARVGHERQGRIEAEPDPLGQRPDGQGDVRPPRDYRYPFMAEE